ncbi:NADAR family protein [Actinomadura parmotrematis]|uniref:NADAR family protein n=1 Tax=Actinomadura parmotrematis TaxID=2864039 RepID=A0ABS7FSE4_9ACTN|nr:NADAR family protein [Actinomadura parmotrematis]MBW8483130.1 NADAR family protein [Actinomadura parmotrematis]
MPVRYRGREYPSVTHAYWALAAADPGDHDRVRDAATARDAHELGGRVPHPPDWPDVRTAVMAELLRAKFAQHPQAADRLVATGDARILYTGFMESRHWLAAGGGSGEGLNWMGRLLELIRAEILWERREPGVS